MGDRSGACGLRGMGRVQWNAAGAQEAPCDLGCSNLNDIHIFEEEDKI